jgi:hypothetical protein
MDRRLAPDPQHSEGRESILLQPYDLGDLHHSWALEHQIPSSAVTPVTPGDGVFSYRSDSRARARCPMRKRCHAVSPRHYGHF